VLTGSLAGGVDGTLALYTYTDVYYDKNGRQETDYHFTVSMVDIPECVQFVPGLYCNRKSGFRFMEKMEDVFRSKERVHLESEALEEHYEIFVDKGQDQNWLHQLFSPTFIVWLTDSAPDKFAFELESGELCCNVSGHKKDASHLDGMREAAASVAQPLTFIRPNRRQPTIRCSSSTAKPHGGFCSPRTSPALRANPGAFFSARRGKISNVR